MATSDDRRMRELLALKSLAEACEVAKAFRAIRDERLYRETHATFDDYVREKWGLSEAAVAELSGLIEHGETT